MPLIAVLTKLIFVLPILSVS